MNKLDKIEGDTYSLERQRKKKLSKREENKLLKRLLTNPQSDI